MKVYGLTGGIASGKSAASAHFRKLRVPVIDSDALADRTLDADGAALQSVVDHFGTDILEDGEISRGALAKIVFQDTEELAFLNQLIHPLVYAECDRLCAEYAEAGHRVTIIEAALHAEDGTLRKGLDELIVVDCPVEIRLQRMIDLREMSHEEAMRRINAQIPPENKFPLARWIIHNDKGLDHLYQQVENIVKEF